MATTRQPLTPITDPVSPVHRLRLTVSRRGSLWHYELAEDGQPAELQPLPGRSTACLDQNGFRFPHPEPIAPIPNTPDGPPMT